MTGRLRGLHLVSSTTEGLALSTLVLHATTGLGLSASLTGLVLGAAAGVALLLAVPIGALADRVGLRRAYVAAASTAALGLVGYAVAGSFALFAVSVLLFVATQSISQAIRQAIAVTGVVPAARVAVRAEMHTWLNVGIGLGTTVGAGLAWTGADGAFRSSYVVAAVACLGVAGAARRLPDGREVAVTPPSGRWTVLGDRPFLVAVGLSSAVQLTMPVLSVLIPVWVTQRTTAPGWAPGAALALNTVLVLVGQRRWARTLVSPAAVSRSAGLGGLGLLLAGVLLGAAAGPSGAAGAATLLGLAVLALTVGEIAAGAATWVVALDRVPPGAEGRYQSTFAMGTSLARIVGPSLALPLVLHAGARGWWLLAVVMAAACGGVVVLNNRRSRA
ncbi:MFS transporter [Marmoricola endophyticus]|uniref:MFS transporter n=1 Tax=Marmoricola endophyticus TaxID=2040280 RepID=A0A917BCE8_9ACTN|nr:MFS transporter [Marmoricola endophyticus]